MESKLAPKRHTRDKLAAVCGSKKHLHGRGAVGWCDGKNRKIVNVRCLAETVLSHNVSAPQLKIDFSQS